MSLLPYLCTQGRVILRYFRLILIPYGFTVDPDIPTAIDWGGWLAWAAILGTAAVLWKRYRSGKWFAAGLLLLMPSSSVFPAADLAADRRLYLPMIAFAALAGILLERANRRLLVVPLALALAMLSFARTRVWLSEHALWSEAVERAPGKLRPLLQLSRASDPETALRLLENAQRLAPNDSRPPQEKGLRLLAMNRPDEALAQFERALMLLPDDPDLLNNRGVALTYLGRREAAAEEFRRALAINPCLAMARRNLQRLGIEYVARCPEGIN
jgi:tetratricopeptide (TPR) repeat protein